MSRSLETDWQVPSPTGADQTRFEHAIELFDKQNEADPHSAIYDDHTFPAELFHARELTKWVLRIDPQASEALLLASRCQHICRWRIPRHEYPMDRAGYHRWRNEMKQFHARLSGEILQRAGYPAEMTENVAALNLKKNFPADPEAQTLEDALCLEFLEHQLSEFTARTEEGKVVNALKKSWNKMSPRAREAALTIPFDERSKNVIKQALDAANAA